MPECFSTLQDLCVRCLDAPRQMLIQPCQHVCLCNGCGTDPFGVGGNCPICRQPIVSIQPDITEGVKWLMRRRDQTQKYTEMFAGAFSGNIAQLRMSLQSGAHVNFQNDFTLDTALITAVKSRQLEACEFLLEHKADVQLKNKAGKTALHIAQDNKDQPVLELLRLVSEDAMEQLLAGLGTEGDDAGIATGSESPSLLKKKKSSAKKRRKQRAASFSKDRSGSFSKDRSGSFSKARSASFSKDGSASDKSKPPLNDAKNDATPSNPEASSPKSSSGSDSDSHSNGCTGADSERILKDVDEQLESAINKGDADILAAAIEDAKRTLKLKGCSIRKLSEMKRAKRKLKLLSPGSSPIISPTAPTKTPPTTAALDSTPTQLSVQMPMLMPQLSVQLPTMHQQQYTNEIKSPLPPRDHTENARCLLRSYADATTTPNKVRGVEGGNYGNVGSRAPEKGSPEHQDLLHIFVDNSNLCFGANNETSTSGAGAGAGGFKGTGLGAKFTLQVLGLIEKLEQGRNVEERWVCGSGGRPEYQQLRLQWKRSSFRQKWDDRSGPETNVDEALHAQILHTLSKSFATARTLVLLTGDGNSNNNSCSFPNCVESALRKGWRVELWSWRRSTSKVYKSFAQAYQSQFVLMYLDDVRESFVFEPAGIVPCVRNRKDGSKFNRSSSNTCSTNYSTAPTANRSGRRPRSNTMCSTNYSTSVSSIRSARENGTGTTAVIEQDGEREAGSPASLAISTPMQSKQRNRRPRALSCDGIQDKDLCVVCLEAPRQTVLLPCKHLCLCDACAVELFQPEDGRDCPMCRGPIQSTLGGVFA